MTDIRKHGFENDAQWREHLAEVEETSVRGSPVRAPDSSRGLDFIGRDLADLRLEVDALRHRIRTRNQQERRTRLWLRLGGGALLVLLAAASFR